MKRALLLSLSLLVSGSTLIHQPINALTSEQSEDLFVGSAAAYFSALTLYGLYGFGKWVATAEKTKTQKVCLKAGSALSSLAAAVIPAAYSSHFYRNNNFKSAGMLFGLSTLLTVGSFALCDSAIEEYNK